MANQRASNPDSGSEPPPDGVRPSTYSFSFDSSSGSSKNVLALIAPGPSKPRSRYAITRTQRSCRPFPSSLMVDISRSEKPLTSSFTSPMIGLILPVTSTTKTRSIAYLLAPSELTMVILCSCCNLKVIRSSVACPLG